MADLEDALGEMPEGVSTEIDPDEEMYVAGREDAYFAAGRSALRAVRLGLLAARIDAPRRILDMPCGHGRILRMLKAGFPDAELTACDLNTEGVEFCERVFGATPVYSTLQADEVPLDDEFDLIWSGSLVTHLDLDRWRAFFALYERALAPGGVLVMTTFGRWPAERLRRREFTYDMTETEIEKMLEQFDRDGFAYSDYPGQTLSGMSLTSPSWLVSHVEQRSELRILSYTERGWSDRQDVIVLQRPKK